VCVCVGGGGGMLYFLECVIKPHTHHFATCMGHQHSSAILLVHVRTVKVCRCEI
jgi:hypothetical protein